MNRQVMRVVAGANLVAGCLLLQGCGMFGKKTDTAATTVPGGEQPPVEVQPVEPATPGPQVETAPVELPPVQATTPYTIQKGDTLSSIAYKYSLRWQDVVAVNPGISPNRLRIGQTIQLPGQVDVAKARHVPTTAPKVTAPKSTAPKSAAVSGPMTSYVVKSGDSLSVIAYKHGIKTAALREANGLKSDRLSVGQKLKVPGAKKTPASDSSAKKTASADTAKVAAPKTVAPKTAVEAAPAVTPPPPPAVTPAPAPATPAPSAPSVESAAVKVETTTPPPAPAADANAQTYTVKEGEDLYAVAIRWGVSPSDLKALNNLTSTDLKAGTVLKIPGGAQ